MYRPSNGHTKPDLERPNACPYTKDTHIRKNTFEQNFKFSYRSVQQSGLTQSYGDDSDFSQQIRALPTLSFLPAANIIPTFGELKYQFPVQVQPVIYYFDHTYIDMKDRLSRPRKTSKFALELWNTNKNTWNDHHRTNNVVEG
ncbi:unnamed protein product [Didymodactylos carnosus]|uniref:Uncharacterized protein n=1 Tax=Didymodactylos carnosus TaxID=1234261 RepID=A0A814HF62_9BILA|nr:unnamed protein product [Didymodactylos carnosus]CAF1010109.1 unnamed protein product [Didymodactylos carnosus]CAF3718857.1 unnamed protein product [Didymodactylos carnosus]CAF3781371.1 unnamed protein product [Didymodactylos carnosus]